MRNSIAIVALALLPMSFAQAQTIPTAERDALIAFYNGAGGDNWLDKTNWLGAVGTECTWFGVVCDGTPNVQQLSMVSNDLSGSIPPDLEDLSSLTDLDLNSNQVSGSIPMELKNLVNLSYLNLSFNQLTGSIPPGLGDLSNLTYLNVRGNQLSGSLPPDLGDLSNLTFLSMGANQFSGSIPQELGSLSSLQRLYLPANQLSGSLPAQLGDLSSLETMYLSNNQLSGDVPAELGSLSSLLQLRLGNNQLSGTIPPELGNLSSLERLYLYSNRLSGSIPTALENLTALVDSDGLRIRWNALHSDDASLIAFLDAKQFLNDWQTTQTIAPENLAVDRVGDHTVWLTWDAVSYQSDRGGYSVCSAPTSSGAWTCDGWTEEKTDTTYPVTGLDPATGTGYDFAVVTYTDPHVDNQNVVNSDFSSLETATTATVGCGQPEIEIMWGSPITLAVSGSYDSYLWITGETTSTIDITPLYDQWYWVTVTSAGPCEETALTWVDPTTVFANGFESGDTTRWSNTVP